jgi:hypothetical protein
MANCLPLMKLSPRESQSLAVHANVNASISFARMGADGARRR